MCLCSYFSSVQAWQCCKTDGNVLISRGQLSCLVFIQYMDAGVCFTSDPYTHTHTCVFWRGVSMKPNNDHLIQPATAVKLQDGEGTYSCVKHAKDPLEQSDKTV